jgi:hypothetical protein
MILNFEMLQGPNKDKTELWWPNSNVTLSIHLYFSLSWYNIYEVTKQSTISITKKRTKASTSWKKITEDIYEVTKQSTISNDTKVYTNLRPKIYMYLFKSNNIGMLQGPVINNLPLHVLINLWKL